MCGMIKPSSWEPDWSSLLNTIRGDVRRLDSTIRYNSIPVYQQESVATHSFWVSFYSLLVHKQLHPEQNSMLESSVLKHALLHDIGECLTGDVVRTFKYSSQKFKEAVDLAEYNMVERYMPIQIKQVLNEIEMDSTSSIGSYIKCVVKVADFISLYMFMNREWIRGNREILPFIDRMQKDLRLMGEKTRASDEWFDKAVSSLYFSMADETFLEPSTRTV
jgi:5'-deoxynucleotidase YfbR-like HD superfamily hydrolase